jgi:predicted N-acyltransferase
MGVSRDLAVSAGVGPGWDGLMARTPLPVPVTGSERWIRFAPRRLPGEQVTVVLSEDGDARVAIYGAIMTRPSPNDRIDPFSIFSGASAHQGLAVRGPHPWHGLRAEQVYPCLLLMLPHYESFPVGPGAVHPETCDALVQAVLDWAAGQGIRSIAYEYLTPESEPLIAALRRAGWPVTELAGRCDLAVTWPDFDGYLARLSKHRRVEVRRELRALAGRGIGIQVRCLADAEPEMIDLRCQLVAKYGGNPDPEKEEGVLRRIRSIFSPEDVTVIMAERDGQALGCGVFIQDADTWVPVLTGADYGSPRHRLTYFSTIFYTPAGMAPGLGVKKIPYGLGSWEAKRLRGCDVNALFGAALVIDR